MLDSDRSKLNDKQDFSVDLEKIDIIIKKYNPGKEAVISILQDIQNEYHFLPREALMRVSNKLDIPLTQIYGVATFFKAFSLVPKGKHIINICLGTACHVRASKNILQKIEEELGIKNGGTTDDMQFSLETVNCLGACALGPVVVIDGEYHGHMKSSQVGRLLKKYSKDTGSVD